MGIIEVYQTIRKNVERKHFDSRPWIGGMATGAWKIQVGKSDDQIINIYLNDYYETLNEI